MGLIKTILILLLIYYGIKIISKFLKPFLFKYVANKVEKKFSEQFGKYEDAQTKEGETTIDKVPTKKSSTKKVGEYVDFEELEE